jgi:hypothetical protein
MYETVTKTVQRPKTVMEEKTITIQEPKEVAPAPTYPHLIVIKKEELLAA